MDEPAEKPFETTEESAERGRRQSTAAAVSTVGALLLLGMQGAVMLLELLAQLVAFGLLFLQHFRGRVWARWLLVVLIALIAAGNIWNAIMGPERARVLSIGLAIILTWNALVLAFSRRVTDFLRVRRARSG